MKTTTSILFLVLLIYSCGPASSKKNNNKQPKKLHTESDSLQSKMEKEHTVLTSLTFQKNDAEQAMNLYVSLSDDAKIIDIQRWGADGPGKEGTIMQAIFELKGHRFMVSDSPPVHNWDFSPAVSTYIDCENEEEIERIFAKLAENGTVAMPLDNYGFSQKFAWIIDQHGVSWQLNLK